MENNAANRVKSYLEKLYDIPFDVEEKKHYSDSWFDIKPHNLDKELFDVEVKFKNQIRMIIEVRPEKYSAFAIADMSKASDEKKKMFTEYANQLSRRRAKIDFYINDNLCDIQNSDSWPQTWSNYKLRISKSPICREDETLDAAKTTATWTGIVVGMFLSLLNITENDNDLYVEGGLNRIETNRYERNPVNRELCLAANGYNCKICGFSFERKYGEIGHHFIHVHHIVPVSDMKKEYMINPVSDLIPVCPNCHAMLHRQDPPFLPDELIEIIGNTEKQMIVEEQT